MSCRLHRPDFLVRRGERMSRILRLAQSFDLQLEIGRVR